MKTKSWNIFKTTNAITLTEFNLESTYIVLHSSRKSKTIKRLTQYTKAVQIYATFNF